jgi:hypothetical protein
VTAVHVASAACHVRHAGDYVICVTVEGASAWADAEGANCRVDVVVCDAADGRFVPELWVAVTLIDSGGEEIGAFRQPFLWHPQLHRYTRNWTVSEPGKYRIRVRVEPPTFARVGGGRYLDPVEVEFQDVPIDYARA